MENYEEVVKLLSKCVAEHVEPVQKKPIDIEVVNTSTNILPQYAREGDAGMDARAYLGAINPSLMYGGSHILGGDENLLLVMPPNSRCLIPSGLAFSVPAGYEMQIRPRSGLALKYGITLTNSPATIDSGYRGDVGIILQNTGSETVTIEDGERIGQFVLSKFETINWVEVKSLSESSRGDSGFGDSGKK